MFANPSLVTRISIGKGLGFIGGLIGFIMLPYFWPEADLMTRWGVLLWYTTFGAIIGVFGVFTWHPILRLSMPWWFRGIVLGAWLNFVLTFFTFDVMSAMLASTFGPNGFFLSPYWFVLEGAAFGLLIDYIATKFGGEGTLAVANLPEN